MPKNTFQKLKLLYLYKILLEHTDEEHTLTIPQMIAELEKCGIKCERKAIYDDIEALRHFGLDLVCRKTKTTDYYVASKTFELPELKLLADAVASSKFITEKKSNELIEKIGSLTSVNEAKQLRRQVIVANRVKAMNEHIYYNVDAIHKAIAAGKQIRFKYFHIGPDRQKQYRDGDRTASPYALSWHDENYYLIAFYEKYGDIAHFRVDKMENIEPLEAEIIPHPRGFDIGEYTKKVFSMFGGEDEHVTLRFNNSLTGVVFDKFGSNVNIKPCSGDRFTIRVKVAVSTSFYGWLFQFDGKAEIVSPKYVKEAYINMAQRIADASI